MRVATGSANGIHTGAKLGTAGLLVALATVSVAGLGALGASPTSASSTTFYAASTALGAGNCATPADACTLTTALSDVAPGGTIELVTAGSPSTLYSGGFTIDTAGTSALSPVTIERYAGVTNPTLDGGNTQTVLTVDSGVYLDISGVTIHDGSGPNSDTGGGISNEGTLSVSDSTLSDNSSPGGGGILNTGTLHLSDSTLSDNSNPGAGGAINNDPGDTATISDSTLVDNSATSPPGLHASGGAIFNDGTLNLSDSTLAGNSASTFGGAIDGNGGTVDVEASIVANDCTGVGTPASTCSGAGVSTVPACSGTITDEGYNIGDDGTCDFTATGSINDSSSLDASLGSLKNNGGTTDTILPTSTSPAADVITDSTSLNGFEVCPRTDQRGVASNGKCTIGAVEAGFLITTTSLPNATPGTAYGPVTLTTQEAGISASPHVTTLKWKKVSLPKGLKLSKKTGVLSGTPGKKLTAGTSSVKVQVTETVTTLNGKKKVKTKTTVNATIPLTIT